MPPLVFACPAPSLTSREDDPSLVYPLFLHLILRRAKPSLSSLKFEFRTPVVSPQLDQGKRVNMGQIQAPSSHATQTIFVLGRSL